MSEASGAGLLGNLRALADAGLDLVQTRLALLGNELEEQKVRVVEGLVLALAGVLLLVVATVLLCGFVVMLFAEGYRLAALGVITAAFAGAGAWLVARGGQRLRGGGVPFQASMDELRKDREAIGRRGEGTP